NELKPYYKTETIKSPSFGFYISEAQFSYSAQFSLSIGTNLNSHNIYLMFTAEKCEPREELNFKYRISAIGDSLLGDFARRYKNHANGGIKFIINGSIKNG